MATSMVTNFKTTLTSGLTSGGSETTITLGSVTTTDGHTLVMADIGDIGFIVIAPGTSSMEICSFTGISGTSLTGVTRGLPFYGTSTSAVSANKKAHGSGEIVIISNNHHWFSEQYVTTDDTQTISGVKTFSVLPATTAGNPTDDNEFARKAYVDLVGTGSATMDKLIVAGTAGATVAAGDLVYLDSSDSEWKLCDADTASTVDNVQLGIAQGAGTDGNAISNGVLLFGLDANQSGLTANSIYYASNTAGDISSSAGTTEVTVGIAISTTEILFVPRVNQQITESQQDFIEKATTNSEWYGVSAAGTDSYAITVTPTFAAYASGMRFRFKTDVANTGAATLNVNALGAVTIKKQHDQDLATGDVEAGQIVEVVHDGTNFQMVSQGSLAAATVDIQTFSSSGTWTKPSGALSVDVYCFGAGGGGGSGRAESAGTNEGGGAGGGGGEYVFKRFIAAGLSSSETVTVGTGGTGGTAVTATANGNNGSAGGASSFGTTTLLKAAGGSGGQGGRDGADSTAGAGGTGGNGEIIQAGGAGTNGKGSGNDPAPDGTNEANDISPRGGGAGGIRGTSALDGGNGSGFVTNFVSAGGTNGSPGADGTDNDTYMIGGTGGGGGNGGGGAGGDGGFPGGGGGGGGGSQSTSGSGGDGANGYVVVITYI